MKAELAKWDYIEPVHAILQYASGDPFAIHLHFADRCSVEKWPFGRDLLVAALGCRGRLVGEGDLRIQRYDDERLAFYLLPSGSPHAKLTLSLPAVAEFLGATLQYVPIGAENQARADRRH